MEAFGVLFCGALMVLGAIGAIVQKRRGTW